MKLLHHLMIFPLYPCCFQFTEQFRQTDVSGFISRLAGIDSQRISGKALAGTCGSDQDDILSLADVAIIRQTFQRIPVQVPVRQIIMFPRNADESENLAILTNLLILLLCLESYPASTSSMRRSWKDMEPYSAS